MDGQKCFGHVLNEQLLLLHGEHEIAVPLRLSNGLATLTHESVVGCGTGSTEQETVFDGDPGNSVIAARTGSQKTGTLRCEGIGLRIGPTGAGVGTATVVPMMTSPELGLVRLTL
jgi:hypothetical protein